MKKIFLLFIVAILLLIPLVGCNGQVDFTPTSTIKLPGKLLVVDLETLTLLLLDSQGNIIKEVDRWGPNMTIEQKMKDGSIVEKRMDVSVSSSTIAVSPDYKNICYQKFYGPIMAENPSYLFYMNTDDLEVKEIPVGNDVYTGNIQWLSNEVIAFVVFNEERETKELFTFNVQTNKKERVCILKPYIATEDFYNHYVSWFPEKRMFYNFICNYNPSDCLYEIGTVQEVQPVEIVKVLIAPKSGYLPDRPYWSEDGSALFFQDINNNDIKSIDTATGEVKELISAGKRGVYLITAVQGKIIYFDYNKGSYWIANEKGRSKKLLWEPKFSENDKEEIHTVGGLSTNYAIFQEVTITEKNTKISTYLINLNTLQRQKINLPSFYLKRPSLLDIVSPDERYFFYEMEDDWEVKTYYLFDLKTRKIVGIQDFTLPPSYAIYRWLN